MYSSTYFPSAAHSNPYNSNYYYHQQTSDYHNNQYYAQKIYDDHRLQRRMLQKPAFLIKQQTLYPQYNSYRIGSALNYADQLTKQTTNKYYNDTAEQQRIRIQGRNPFNQNNPYLAASYKHSILKKSSRSRLDTNPNLGVTSYEVLNETQPQLSTTNRKRQLQQISAIKRQKQGIEDYITKSILDTSSRKYTDKSRQPIIVQNQIIRQQQNSDDNFFQSKRHTFNPAKSIRKTSSTIVNYKENPQQIVYKGKKYLKLTV